MRRSKSKTLFEICLSNERNNAQIERFIRPIDTSIVVLPFSCIQFKQNNWRVIICTTTELCSSSTKYQSVCLNVNVEKMLNKFAAECQCKLWNQFVDVNVEKNLNKAAPAWAPDGWWPMSAHPSIFNLACSPFFSSWQTFCIFSALSNQFQPKLLGLIRQYVVSYNKMQNQERK